MSFPSSLPAPRVKHTRFVKTPLITDTLHLQAYQTGQWIELAWGGGRKSRFHSMNARGNVIAFHYPRANVQFSAYCAPTKERRREMMMKGNT